MFPINIHFSQFWKLGNPRSRGLHIQCLMRTGFLVHKWPSSHCILTWWKRWWSSQGSLSYGRLSHWWGLHPYDLIASKTRHPGDCCCSVSQSCLTFVTLWTAAVQALLSFTISQSLLKLMSVELVMPPNHLILCLPLLLLPSIFPSIRAFSNEPALPWGDQSSRASASASVLPVNIWGWFPLGLMGLISLLSKGLSRVLLQHHSSKSSVLQCSAFSIVQLSHPYMTTGKTIALTRWTFAGQVMSLIFNMLSRFVIAFLPRSKHLLISWLQSPSTVILEPKKIKSITVSFVSPSIGHVSWDWMLWS